MALDHILLGYLSRGPQTGYDLKKQFDKSAAHFWPARQNQIYRTLTRLYEEGHISRQIVHQLDRPNRKIYEMTESGWEMLRSWLCQPIDEPTWRSHVIGQLFFAGAVDDASVISVLEERLLHLRDELEHYQELAKEEEIASSPEEARDLFFRWLTLDHGIHTHIASIRWLEDAIARIRSKEHAKGKAGALRKPDDAESSD